MGQNIILLKGSVPWNVTTSTLAQAVDFWYSEVSQLNASSISSFTFEEATGHFSQLAWADTSEVGCGLTQFYDESQESPYITIMACNYYTAGVHFPLF